MTTGTLLTYAFLLAALALIVLLFAATRRKRPADFDGGYRLLNEASERQGWKLQYNAKHGEQTTVCDDCGNINLAHDRAVWTTDGASYCPACRPNIRAHQS